MKDPQVDGWTPLHDLALIYLALMHGADAEIDPSELSLMVEKLQEWYPKAEKSEIERVTNEVMLMYVSDSSQQMLETCVASVHQSLPKGQRIAILNDLADLASADGLIVPGEVSYIQHLAHRWGVDQELG